jgi:hypothetical protein
MDPCLNLQAQYCYTKLEEGLTVESIFCPNYVYTKYFFLEQKCILNEFRLHGGTQTKTSYYEMQ